MRGKTQRRRQRRQHKRTRKQRAGAYIYSGTYGCAFGRPPLKCVGAAARQGPDTISKAMTEDDAHGEMLDGRKFQLADPAKLHFIWPDLMCEWDKTDDTPEDEVDSCDKAPDYTHLLMSSDGGTNLHHIKPKYEEYTPFFESLRNLFQGLILMRDRHIAHCDIKPANIVSMKMPDGSFFTRYIDFGLSKDTTALSRVLDFDIFDANYIYWPMETRFYDIHYHNTPARRNTTISGWYSEIDSSIRDILPQDSYYNTWAQHRYNGDALEQVLADLNFDETELALQKLDIFSVGITLAQVYHRFIPQRMRVKPDGTLYVELPIKLYLTTGEDFPRILEWHTQVQNRITNPLSRLIYDMIHIIPARRPTPEAALASYEAILPAMRELFTKQNLFKCLKLTGALGDIPNPPTPTPAAAAQSPFVPSPVNLSRIRVSP